MTRLDTKQIKKNNLSQWRKTVGSATSVRDDVNICFVFLLIDTHNKHGRVLARG